MSKEQAKRIAELDENDVIEIPVDRYIKVKFKKSVKLDFSFGEDVEC